MYLPNFQISAPQERVETNYKEAINNTAVTDYTIRIVTDEYESL